MCRTRKNALGEDEEAQWFWHGDQGWVLYDDSTAEQIETAYESKRDSVDVDGQRFVDFDSMHQVRKDDDTKWRKVKREVIVHRAAH